MKMMVDLVKKRMWLLLWILVPWVAVANPMPTSPMLRIETGMHLADIENFDAQGLFLVTASRDKTVRIWSVKNGKLLRTLRPPIGWGHEGKMFAVAISPDGKLVAAGGWSGAQWDGTNSVYLFDRASGQMVRRIGGLPTVLYNLRFSHDGSRLAVVLRAGGLRVFQVKSGLLEALDRDYDAESTGVDFDDAGRIVAGSMDGFIRLYNNTLNLVGKRKVLGDQAPYSIRFSPDGTKIAVGMIATPRVEILSGEDLHSLPGPDFSGLVGTPLSTVAWSPDGSRLCVAGDGRIGGEKGKIRCWSGGGLGAYQDLFAGSSVKRLAFLPDGKLVFATYSASWEIIDEKGQQVQIRSSSRADFRDNADGFLLNQEGTHVRFAYARGGRMPASFTVDGRVLALDSNLGEDLKPRTEAPNLVVTGLHSGGIDIKLNGKQLPLGKYEEATSLAISPDGTWFMLGTKRYLRCFDQGGNRRWDIPAPGETLAVNISADGRLAVAAFNDGTIRWYRAGTDKGEELLALFPHVDRKRWVAWTPMGYYDTSPGGESLIGWHMNRSPDQAADFFPAPRFRKRFHRPDIISRAVRVEVPETPPLRIDAGIHHK